MPLSRMERQADGEPLNVVLHPPQGKVPCFYSESALAHWLRTVVCPQQHIKFSIPSRVSNTLDFLSRTRYIIPAHIVQ